MNVDPTAALLGLAAGMVAGAAYFAVLWHAVRRLPNARHPLRGLFMGALFRLSVLLGAAYLAAQAGLSVIAGAAVGFLLARTIAVRWLPRQARLLKGS